MRKIKLDLKLCSFRSLQQDGFDHVVLMMAFVVIFGVSGVAFLVLSHASPLRSNSKPSSALQLITTGELSTGIVNGSGHAMCLDDYRNSSSNGAAVSIYPCSTSDQAQKWQEYNDLTIRHNGKCLEVYHQARYNGAKIDLYTCNGGSNQHWHVGRNPDVSLNDLTSVQSGSCLDVYGSHTANNSTVDLWSCDSTDAQTWGWNTGSTIVPGGVTAKANCNYVGGFQGSGTCNVQLGGIQHGIQAASGIAANMVQYAPKCSLNCGHALAQLQVGSDNERNLMEFGWNTTQSYGTPHIGIGLWANGIPLNADANFVQVSKTVKINQAVTAGASATFAIQFMNNQWRLYYNSTEIGYYPESIWTSRGTSLTNLQYVGIFGEGVGPQFGVAHYQLGDGLIGSKTTAGKVSGYTLYGTSTKPKLSYLDAGRAPLYSTGNFTGTAFTYGGPGLP